MLDGFYGERETAERIRQRGSDLIKAVSNLRNRTARKLENQRKGACPGGGPGAAAAAGRTHHRQPIRHAQGDAGAGVPELLRSRLC